MQETKKQKEKRMSEGWFTIEEIKAKTKLSSNQIKKSLKSLEKKWI